jgi:hypothetical protein
VEKKLVVSNSLFRLPIFPHFPRAVCLGRVIKC